MTLAKRMCSKRQNLHQKHPINTYIRCEPDNNEIKLVFWRQGAPCDRFGCGHPMHEFYRSPKSDFLDENLIS